MSTELWKPIYGYDGFYDISNFGNVKSLRSDKLLKPAFRGGYQAVGLYKDNKHKTFPIHRLVALNFLENPNKYNVVNHKNGNKNDNHDENLEWTTVSGNTQHAMDIGLSVPKTLTLIQSTKEGVFIAEYASVKKASQENEIDEKSIYAVCQKKRKSAGGFSWRYRDIEYEAYSTTEQPDGEKVKDFSDYIITRDGQVYSERTKRYMKQTRGQEGYKYVDLYKNNNRKKFSIHKLVADAYLENPDDCPMINHKDGNKENNRVDNLEWCTFSHNMKHYASLKFSSTI